MSLIIILCSYIYMVIISHNTESLFYVPAIHSAFADYTTKLYHVLDTVTYTSLNTRGWFTANFIYATKSRREEGCKNVEGTSMLFRERAPFPVFSFSLLLLFIPSFLPSFRDMRTMRCIFLLVITCTFYYLVFISSPYCGSLLLSPTSHPPNIPCLCHITRRACKFNSPRSHPLARHHFLRPPPFISAGLKSKLLEIGSGRHRSLPIPQGNT